DRNFNAAPIGVPGELCIGGIGVARGYLNRPDLTAEKFIPDPFSGIKGARLYCTGDLVRWREDGNVDFIGRVDDQVKIRGFRVELGEIESALRSHPDIREAAVVARADGGQDKKLAACFVTENNKELDVGDLRAFLRKSLPDYMIPHAFMALEALPKMISGKVDRKALPEPDYGESVQESSGEPENETEAQLVEIFKEILGRDQVGTNDNFFEFGGDSIMSIQVIAKANQAGIKLSPKQLFENPTVRGLASVAGQAAAVVAEQGTVEGPVPLTPIMHWFFEQDFADAHHWNQSLLLQIDELLDVETLQRALQKIIEHHDALRLRFMHDGDAWTAMNESIGAVDVLQIFDFSDKGDDRRRLVEEKCAALQKQLNPQKGRMIVAAYFGLGTSSRLFIAVHHLAMDGVSWRILLQDIQTAYQQAASGPDISLPAKSTAFKYWAEKLADYAQSSTLRKQLPYWTNYERQLVSPLPVDFMEKGANDEASVESVGLSLSAEETKKLLQELPTRLDAHINDILLAALVVAFKKWTGKRSLLIDMEGHGRENLFDDVDVSRTIGWFTTLYPVFLKVDRDLAVKDVVRSIRDQMKQLPDNGIGYGLLRYLAPEDDMRKKLGAMPQPQVSFNYLGQFDQLMDASSPFKPAGESKGPEHSAKAQRANLIDVTAVVSGEKMYINFSYSKNIHKKMTIEAVLNSFIETLKKMIGDDQQPVEKGRESERNLANLNRRQMNKVLGQLNKKGKRF
ncbi:MAG: AMP-binding protein, partial [Actinobacteria bacterium]|nr:AMP-binding protein [Actinomycetota bacterium]